MIHFRLLGYIVVIQARKNWRKGCKSITLNVSWGPERIT